MSLSNYDLPIDFRFACFIIGGVSSTWAGIYFRKQFEEDSTKYFFASFISQSPSLIPQKILNAIFDVDIDFIQHSMHMFGLFRIWQRSRHFSSVSLNQKEFSKASRKVTRGIFMQTDSWAHQGVHPHKDNFTFFSSLYDRAVCEKKFFYGSKIRWFRNQNILEFYLTFRFGFENANASNPRLFLPHPPEHPSLQQLVITKINIKYLNKKLIKFMFFHELKI